MKLTDAGVIDAISLPLADNVLSQGSDLRYESDFEEIESEIYKLNSVHKDNRTDWKLVQELGYIFLTKRSKDLRVFCWYSLAQIKNNGLTQLVPILELIKFFLEQCWGSCFPVKKDTRLAAFNWFFERIDFNKDGYADNLSHEELSALISSLDSCSEKLNDKFGERAPYLITKLQQLRQVELNKKANNVKPIAVGDIPQNNYSSNYIAIPTMVSVTEDEDYIRIARYLQDQSRLLISWFLNKDLADPRAYLLTRSSAWLQLAAIPTADINGITKLKPLTTNKLQEYQQRLATKEFAALIPDLEISLSKAPFWLDGHYWCYQALEGLGYHQMASHIREYLRSLLTKFPELENLYFDDGTPFASDVTKTWLSIKSNECINDPTFINFDEEKRPWVVALVIAQENTKKDKSSLREEIKKLQISADTASSDREKVMWLLALAKLCQQHQHYDLSALILEDIYRFVEQFNLNKWEPFLAKEILQQLLFNLEKINIKKHQEKINEIKANLYRMDISIAF